MKKVDETDIKDISGKEKKKEDTILLPIIKDFKKEVFSVSEFNKLDINAQSTKVKEILEKIYNGTLEISKYYVNKALAVLFGEKDNFNYLPCNLRVEKKKDNYIFVCEKGKSSLPLIILLFLGAFVFFAITASYFAIEYKNTLALNIDLNSDGKADLNVDIDDDGEPEMNIDTDEDNKPDLNINFNGDYKIIFNIDLDNDGKPDFNKTNQTDENGICKVNCDTNNDGWPDLNIDVDGDGIIDFNKDLDNDKVPDLNFDFDGDLECDLMCDVDHDDKCDNLCIMPDVLPPSSTGVSEEGDPNSESGTPSIKIKYTEGEVLYVENLFPTDQYGIEINLPQKAFTVENLSAYTVTYDIKWIVIRNTFTTQNFKYKIDATNGGRAKAYSVAPEVGTHIIASDIQIGPKMMQKYNITMMLEGTGQNQNDDQGKVFAAKIEIVGKNVIPNTTN